jgi:hypothetical protein
MARADADRLHDRAEVTAFIGGRDRDRGGGSADRGDGEQHAWLNAALDHIVAQLVGASCAYGCQAIACDSEVRVVTRWVIFHAPWIRRNSSLNLTVVLRTCSSGNT